MIDQGDGGFDRWSKGWRSLRIPLSVYPANLQSMKALTVSLVSGHGSQKIAIKDKNEKDGKDEGRCCAEVYC